jgi:hypothetical protein
MLDKLDIGWELICYSAFFFAGAFFATAFFSVTNSAACGVSEGAFFDEKLIFILDGFNALSALSATRAFVIIFGAPCCFAMTSLIPETANIFRTAPQAMIPVPG